MILPMALAKKEEAFSFDDMTGDLSDEKILAETMEKANATMKRTLSKEPMVAHRISKAFDEAIEAGHFDF